MDVVTGCLTCDECQKGTYVAARFQVDLGGYYHSHDLCPACLDEARADIKRAVEPLSVNTSDNSAAKGS